MSRKIDSLLSRLINWLIKYNRPVIISFVFFLVSFEIFEPIVKKEPLINPFHLIELIFYFVLIILVRVLIDFLIKANTVQARTLEILNYKHDLSLELSKLENWEKLKDELVRLPGRIAAVETSRLHILNPISNNLELVECWSEDGIESADFHHDCQQCIRARPKDELLSGVCMTEMAVSGSKPSPQEFCIPINYGDELLGLLQIRLSRGENLSSGQVEIFENIRPEIALALKVSQERKVLSEMQIINTSMAERRTVSTFIHDQLGQNLGYMHLKIDQLAGNENVKNINEVQTELLRLRDVANESYEIVRDILKTIQSETIPNLSNLLKEQAKTVSRRANFKLDFKSMGTSTPLLPAVQQSIFFTFREILSNVEKHANASKVEVLVEWNDGILNISVADNGKGFEPDKVRADDHFGLYIMQERMAGVKGKLAIKSSANSGTVVSISVPFQSTEKVVT